MTIVRSISVVLRSLVRGHKKLAAVTGALLLGGIAAASTPEPLIPLPKSIERQEGVLRITGAPKPQVSGCSAPMVSAALARFERDLQVLTGLAPVGAPLSVSIRCLSQDRNILTLVAKEAYRLTVSNSGVDIQADAETGVLRALATLRQLASRDAQGPVFPFVRIDDAPRFAWRGVMVDTARHFMTVATLKRQIDAMEIAKLNVLHLHLSDNEAFRVESRKFPKLTEVSAPGGHYTQAHLRELVAYAGERGIRVVPEFDIPGHNLALLKAYPELGVAPIDPNDPLVMAKGALNPASEQTYRFLKTFFAEMTPLFPDRYFHIGGDEVSDAAWKDSAAVEAFKKKEQLASKFEVEAWFHSRVRQMLAAHGKTTVGWDEIAESALPKDVIVQAWRTSNPVATATAKGNRVIVSAGYYLSMLQPAEFLYAIDPVDPNAFATMTAEELAGVRRSPATAALVSDGLAATPQPPLTPEQEKLVIGGEAPVWAELVTDELLDGMLWPRALTIGERFWSPASVRDADDLYRRLVPAVDQLRAFGLQDQRLRHRMIVRLAPDAPQVVANLLDLVAPTRNFSRAKRGHYDPIELADMAAADPSTARRFRVDVSSYLAGDRPRGALLWAQLSSWRDNEPAFARVAQGRPLLEAALPTASDIAALGKLGLSALDAIEAGKPMAAEQASAGRKLLSKLKDFEDQSKGLASVYLKPRPPADLIVLVAPDVAKLLDAAGGARSE